MVLGTDLYYKPWLLFGVIQSLGLLFFVAGIVFRFTFYSRGKKTSLFKRPDYLLIAKAFVRDVILQKQLAARSIVRWLIHVSIFYGFIGLLLLSAVAVVLETLIPEGARLSVYMLQGQGYNYYKAAGDLFGLLILSGLIAAIIRRYIVRDGQLDTAASDTVALALLVLIVATGFLLEAMRISLLPPSPVFEYSFIGCRLAEMFRGLGEVPSLASALWIFHAALNALLLAYIPHSKFMHIVNSPVEIVLNASEERMRGDLYL